MTINSAFRLVLLTFFVWTIWIFLFTSSKRCNSAVFWFNSFFSCSTDCMAFVASSISLKKKKTSFLPGAYVVWREGTAFTGVCLSTGSGGGGGLGGTSQTRTEVSSLPIPWPGQGYSPSPSQPGQGTSLPLARTGVPSFPLPLGQDRATLPPPALGQARAVCLWTLLM